MHSLPQKQTWVTGWSIRSASRICPTKKGSETQANPGNSTGHEGIIGPEPSPEVGEGVVGPVCAEKGYGRSSSDLPQQGNRLLRGVKTLGKLPPPKGCFTSERLLLPSLPSSSQYHLVLAVAGSGGPPHHHSMCCTSARLTKGRLPP